jgi:hypothetical protein
MALMMAGRPKKKTIEMGERNNARNSVRAKDRTAALIGLPRRPRRAGSDPGGEGRAAMVGGWRWRGAPRRDRCEATTVTAILARADMARGALYHYFPGGKRDLFTAVVEVVDQPPLHPGRLRPHHPRRGSDRRPRPMGRGGEYEMLRSQLLEAEAAGETEGVPADVMAASLYGAVRRAGEFVIAADDRTSAADEAARSLDLLLDGLAR